MAYQQVAKIEGSLYGLPVDCRDTRAVLDDVKESGNPKRRAG